MSDAPKKSLGMPVEMARQRLKENPEIIAMAKTVQMDLDEFVERCLYYAQHPDAEPELQVLSDEDQSMLEAEGEIATQDDVVAFFEAASRGELPSQNKGHAKKDGFEAGPSANAKKMMNLGGAPLRAPMHDAHLHQEDEK